MDEPDMLDDVVLFRKTYLAIDGSAVTALLVSQLYYLQQQADKDENDFGAEDDEGRRWFYKSQEELKKSTGLSEYHQRQARNSLLENVSWYSEEKRGNPYRLHFHIDRAAMKRWVIGLDSDTKHLVESDESDSKSAPARTEVPNPSETSSGTLSNQGAEGFGSKEPNPSEAAKDARADQRSHTKNTSQTTSSSSPPAPTREDPPDSDHTPDTDDTPDADHARLQFYFQKYNFEPPGDIQADQMVGRLRGNAGGADDDQLWGYVEEKLLELSMDGDLTARVAWSALRDDAPDWREYVEGAGGGSFGGGSHRKTELSPEMQQALDEHKREQEESDGGIETVENPFGPGPEEYFDQMEEDTSD